MTINLSWFLLLMFLNLTGSSLRHAHHQREIHKIMKRMAENGDQFEGHDVAHVMSPEVQGQSKRRLAKRDLRKFGNRKENNDFNEVQLHLSSGSKINLALRSSGIVDSTTDISHLMKNGRHVRKIRDANCYSYGDVKDSSGQGWAAFSHCDGLFGFAGSSGYDYFVHPVEKKRSKREEEDDFDVHVLWRRSLSENVQMGNDFLDDVLEPTDNSIGDTVTDVANTSRVVIELAMFSDAKYCKRLHLLYPGREDDFLLTRLSAAQALYSNAEKVGHDVQIKVKLLEYWNVDPENYTFGDKMGENLRSFCINTRDKYSYDVHALNTGILDLPGGKVGLAYVGGACSPHRCFAALPIRMNQFVVYAHELGHTLGMNHLPMCPANLTSIGGFMGGGASFNFSPCMKYQFDRFLNMHKSKCLFEESSASDLKSLDNFLPGQSKSPDELCRIFAGPGYRYVPYGYDNGKGICMWWVCIGDDDTYPDFGRVRQFAVPVGFPCREEAFCLSKGNCQSWNETTMAMDIDTLRRNVQPPQWSSWSDDYSFCSRSCGTGVRIRTRDCQYGGYSLSLHCRGSWFKGRLCNTNPCPGDPTDSVALRQARGDEVCARFLSDNIKLNLKDATGYRNTSGPITVDDVGNILRSAHSRSCMLKCDRIPITAEGDLDAFMPDGTPCHDRQRSHHEMDIFGISLRCVRGICVEFSDCVDETDVKDKCGVCNGDGSRCQHLTFGIEYDVARWTRSTLCVIPAGAENVGVTMRRIFNVGAFLELWDTNNNRIIGRNGQYPKVEYLGDKVVSFAGTTWSYKRSEAFLRARGPTNQDVVIKIFRGRGVLMRTDVSYARPLTTN